MNDFYSKLRQRLYSDAKVVNYYAKEKDLGRNHAKSKRANNKQKNH